MIRAICTLSCFEDFALRCSSMPSSEAPTWSRPFLFLWIDTPIGPLRFVFWYSAFAFAFLGILNRRRGEHIERNALYDLQLDWTSLADYFLELVDRCAHGQNCYQ